MLIDRCCRVVCMQIMSVLVVLTQNTRCCCLSRLVACRLLPNRRWTFYALALRLTTTCFASSAMPSQTRPASTPPRCSTTPSTSPLSLPLSLQTPTAYAQACMAALLCYKHCLTHTQHNTCLSPLPSILQDLILLPGTEALLKRRFRIALEQRMADFVYASPTSICDIIFIETALELGCEVYAVLPVPRADHLKYVTKHCAWWAPIPLPCAAPHSLFPARSVVRPRFGLTCTGIAMKPSLLPPC